MAGVGIVGPSDTVVAGGMETKTLASYQGDNTIFVKWNARDRRVSEATSSRRLTADQKIELLTTLVDGKGRIVMRAVLKNISKHDSYRIRGRLVHHVFRDRETVRALRTRAFRVVLDPGDKIVARYAYGLRTGEYSVRTDYLTE
jgi:hypothetical protein